MKQLDSTVDSTPQFPLRNLVDLNPSIGQLSFRCMIPESFFLASPKVNFNYLFGRITQFVVLFSFSDGGFMILHVPS